ncbi:MAG: phosphoribosylformylglycinamidine cyclo-ligase [Candidatus Tectomicrobia bacterium]|uniref:Phosphoribosylformylglycinamidine cyclo-ligase n=1 Tax=Tectimicrobiota bacterium TaxID=2528274 RepID=A0A932FXF8_UNCTE|nr:phosphoribosylformylglycinamidine cyclo-ligase [Candidatus Tectomicrobia bacterium]
MTQPITYAAAGVDLLKEQETVKPLLRWVTQTFGLGLYPPRLPLGYYANVIDLGGGQGLALSADGVGTKLLVAQKVGRYDTVGIDCVAMNVNDLLCVGARPIALLDYLAIQDPLPELLEEIGQGLYEGARQARVSIPGGELAQVREMLRGEREGYGFDLVGMAVGLVPLDRILIGQEVAEGDRLVGLRSSGIHSNGLTLARRVLFEQMGLGVEDRPVELGGKGVGETLLEPTRIYVPEVLEMFEAGLRLKALFHITGDGLLNLSRIAAPMGWRIERLPEPPPIFSLIQQGGKIADEEMFQVFNMGTGFCVAVPPEEVPAIQEIAARHNVEAFALGRAVRDEERKVILEERGLVGQGRRFSRLLATP